MSSYVKSTLKCSCGLSIRCRYPAGGEKLHTRESTELHSSIVRLGAPTRLKGTTTNEGTGLSHVKHSRLFLLHHGKMLPKNQDLWAPTASAIWKFRRKASVEMICSCAVPASSALLIPAVLRANDRYVKSFVRGFRCSITAARSSHPKLRMLSATMNRVPAPEWDKLHGTILHTSEELTSGREWLKTGRPK